MNIPRPVLVREGILDSEKVCGLPLAEQLFFRNLLHVCDGADRFDADADDLRLTLYRRSRDRVKRHHIQQWLLALREARLVTLYTRSGKAFGQVLNYGQRDTKRKVLHPAPDDEAELPLVTDPPATSRAKPPPPPQTPPTELKGSEVKHSTPLHEKEWLAELARTHPGIDIAEERSACVRKYPKAGRKFFVEKWLGNWEPPMEREPEKLDAIEEPAGFVTWFTNRYEKAPPRPWAQMRRDSQQYYVDLMNR